VNAKLLHRMIRNKRSYSLGYREVRWLMSRIDARRRMVSISTVRKGDSMKVAFHDIDCGE